MNREEIIKMAREAGWDDHHSRFDTRIECFFHMAQAAALRQALADEALDRMAENARELGLDYEPADEPVVICEYCEKERPVVHAPQPAAQWVGLTDEEVVQTWGGIIKYAPGEMRVKDFARAIEQALKEKNT